LRMKSKGTSEKKHRSKPQRRGRGKRLGLFQEGKALFSRDGCPGKWGAGKRKLRRERGCGKELSLDTKKEIPWRKGGHLRTLHGEVSAPKKLTKMGAE